MKPATYKMQGRLSMICGSPYVALLAAPRELTDQYSRTEALVTVHLIIAPAIEERINDMVKLMVQETNTYPDTLFLGRKEFDELKKRVDARVLYEKQDGSGKRWFMDMLVEPTLESGIIPAFTGRKRGV